MDIVDEMWAAWNSQDVEKMRTALSRGTHEIDRLRGSLRRIQEKIDTIIEGGVFPYPKKETE